MNCKRVLNSQAFGAIVIFLMTMVRCALPKLENLIHIYSYFLFSFLCGHGLFLSVKCNSQLIILLCSVLIASKLIRRLSKSKRTLKIKMKMKENDISMIQSSHWATKPSTRTMANEGELIECNVFYFVIVHARSRVFLGTRTNDFLLFRFQQHLMAPAVPIPQSWFWQNVGSMERYQFWFDRKTEI